MLPPTVYDLKVTRTTTKKKTRGFIIQSRLFKKTLKYRYFKVNGATLHASLESIPLIPIISFVKTKVGVKSELKFKYIWGWKRPRQNHIFMTKLELSNVSLLGAFYF